MNEQSMKIFEDMQNYVNNPKPSRGRNQRASSIPEEDEDIEAGSRDPQEEERRFSTPQSAGRKFIKWISGGAKSQEKPPPMASATLGRTYDTSLQGAATNEPQYLSVPPAPARMRFALPPTPEARQSMFQDSDDLVEIDLSAMNVSRNLDEDFSDLNLDV